jgi:hypothetical protein
MLGLLSCSHERGPATDASRWRQDLQLLADTLRARHPKLLRPEVRSAFDRDVAALDGRIGGMDRAHRAGELARLVASLHDGHTQIGLAWDDAVGFRSLPIRVYLFREGVFVVRADSDHADLLGSRVESIGTVPIDSALQRLGPWIHGDNESAFRDIVASRLVLADLLPMARLSESPDSATLHLRRPDGSPVAATLRPLDRKASITWVDARPPEVAPPLYLRQRDQPFWFASLDSVGVFWIQFNAVQDSPTDSLGALARRALAAAEQSRATRLVVDIRRNNGGDNTLLRPLVVGLIRSRFNAPRHLYVVIGRLTFSAAMNFATQIERYTEARFVGEPTAAPPNHFGETRRLVLPNSGITVLYSTLFWQDADPRDQRPWIAPAIEVPPTFADYRAGRDPVLDAILHDGGR